MYLYKQNILLTKTFVVNNSEVILGPGYVVKQTNSNNSKEISTSVSSSLSISLNRLQCVDYSLFRS